MKLQTFTLLVAVVLVSCNCRRSGKVNTSDSTCIKKVSNYAILSVKSKGPEGWLSAASSLNDLVTKSISEGWQPIGGVSIGIENDKDSTGYIYNQAMIRY